MPSPEPGTSRRRGEPVVVEEAGSGPPLVLLHGLAGSSRWWSRNVLALSQSHRVAVIDLPGFGTSPGHHRLDLDATASQLVATMDQLGMERASVIGHSMGGLIAGGLAAEHPGRVDRLILVDAAFLSLDRSAGRVLTGPARTLRWTDPSLLPVVIADGFRSGPMRLTDASIQLLRADWRSKLPRIEAPTLVIWGEHDKICPVRIGHRIVESVPGSRLVVIDGAAHNPMWEQADEFNRIVLDFLAA